MSNFRHQTIWTADNLDVMRGMNSERVDLIYLDPPFNSNADYAAPVGSQAAGGGGAQADRVRQSGQPSLPGRPEIRVPGGQCRREQGCYAGIFALATDF